MLRAHTFDKTTYEFFSSKKSMLLIFPDETCLVNCGGVLAMVSCKWKYVLNLESDIFKKHLLCRTKISWQKPTNQPSRATLYLLISPFILFLLNWNIYSLGWSTFKLGVRVLAFVETDFNSALIYTLCITKTIRLDMCVVLVTALVCKKLTYPFQGNKPSGNDFC